MKVNEIKEYLSFFKIKYHSWVGLLLQFILFSTIFASICSMFTQLFGVKPTLYLYLFVNIVLVLIWFFYRKYMPKNAVGTIGLVIALHCEDDLESIGVKNDFISKISLNLRNDGLDKIISVLKVPNHFCSQIKTYEQAREINRRVRGHYFVFGEVVRRTDGEEKIFINLSGLVTHAQITPIVSQSITMDFCQSLPKEIDFLDSFRFKGFLLSADLVYLSAKYIIGIAAFVSGDVKMACNLHEKLINDKLLLGDHLPSNLAEIKAKIKILLAEEYLVLAKVAMMENNQTEYKRLINLSITHSNNIYGSHIFRAIKIFTETQNSDLAMKEVQKAKEMANGAQEWRYSEAFLLYWEGQYENAYKSSKKIIDHVYIGEEQTINEIVSFNEGLLAKFPGKNQLYFWLGFIVYKKLNDLVYALKYFELFEANKKDDQQYLIERSSVFLKEIKKKMSLSE